MSSVPAPRWTAEELDTQREIAIRVFRRLRMTQPVDRYRHAFTRGRKACERLLDATDDLAGLWDNACEVLTDQQLLEAVRYLTGPPISADDLKEIAETTLAPSRMAEPDAARRVIEVVSQSLDSLRFAWIGENRKPTEAERGAASVATAALIASQAARTARMNESKTQQEDSVKRRLVEIGLTEVEARSIRTTREAPRSGEFCGESLLGERKADVVIGLFDERIMPIECKVSNSSTNSVKRLNNDAAAKARSWLDQFGSVNIVPAAVLSGVFKNHNLRMAQDEHLAIFWAHDLSPLASFIEQTRVSA